MNIPTNALTALSNDLADAVERAGAGVVAVEARSRLGSSGFYVRPDLVVTADHTLESDEVEIVFAGGKTATAEIVGRDPATDLALLRTAVHGTPLPFATGTARVGSVSLALARDDDGDVAASMGVIGMVSGAWRTWNGAEIERFIRPDLALYPRFAGGPLVDASGAAIGLNTPGLARRHTVTVPASTIARVVDALLAGGGRIPRGYLGVHLHQVQGGAIVLGVEPGGPAQRGGLIVGDVIATIDGARVDDVADVHVRLGAGSVGRPLALQLLRGGIATAVTVIPVAREEDD